MQPPTNIWKTVEDSELTGYSLIIPSVAVGNVGQLTCDLLISSLQMKKIISIYSTAVIPILGYDPYNLNSSSLSSSCEIYSSDSRKIVVIQLRAPLVYKYAREFLKEIVVKLKEKKIKDIIILTSAFAHERKHILTSPFRYLANNLCPYINDVKTVLKWHEHEATDTSTRIYGGGFASLLYDICNENSVPCLLLYKYCSEGDNVPDAYEMISFLANLLPLFNKSKDLHLQLVQPVSWKLLFGGPPPKDIY